MPTTIESANVLPGRSGTSHAPGGETSYVAETIAGAVAYRVTVVSFDVVSRAKTPR